MMVIWNKFGLVAKKTGWAFVLTVFCVVLPFSTGETTTLLQEQTQYDQVQYLPGEVLVRYREGISEKEGADRVNQLLAKTNYIQLVDQGREQLERVRDRSDRIPRGRVDVERYLQERDRRPVKVYRSQRVSLHNRAPRPVDRMSEEDPELYALIAQLNADPRVEAVSPNILIPFADVPNDTNYQDALLSFDQKTILSLIDIELAWEIQKGSEEVIIAVFDTGIDKDHEDLKDKVVHGINYVGSSSGNQNYQDTDASSHGTAVSGVAAAVTNNNLGVSGICWHCKIMPVRIGASGSFPLSDLILNNSFDNAVTKGASIINMSWGIASDAAVLHSKIKDAHEAGIVLVAAAGNGSSTSVIYPAAYPEVIAVAATDTRGETEERADFSNYGDDITLAAPGHSLYTTEIGDEYALASGTSIATPVISGVVGLILSHRPDLSPSQVLQLLESGADSVAGVSGIGAGRVNARNSLPVAITTTSLPAASASSNYDVTLNGSGGKGSYTWSAISGLPSGMSLSSAGKITGKPTITTIANFNVRVRLQDSSGSGVHHEKTFPLAVNPTGISITTNALPAGTVGQNYSRTLSGAGGLLNYEWSLHSGKLPPGLKLSKSGVISGKLTKLGSYPFTIRLKSADNQTQNKSYTIQVDSSLRHPSGSLLKAVGNPTVWLLTGDELQGFPTPTVYESHNYPWSAIIEVPASTIAIYPVGQPLRIRSGTLVLTPGNPRVYLIAGDKKHPFSNPETFLGLGYSWDGIFAAQPGELDGYKTDSWMALNAPRFEYSRIKSPHDPTVYLLQNINGKMHRRSIPSPGVYFSQGWDWPEIIIIPVTELNAFPSGPILLYRDGSLIKGENSPAVYVMEFEKRRHIPSAEIFLGRGYKWENIITIPDSELAGIAVGKSL